MTFDKAYCEELGGNVTAYKARREFFAQNDLNFKFSFFCPDEKCNVELTGVNIYAIGKVKHKPHFRTKKNCSHSDDCSIVEELDKEAKSIDKGTTTATAHAHKTNKYPDEFILKRPKKENQNKSEQSDDDDFDIEPREKRKSTNIPTNDSKPHKTSYLENVVDSYEDMNEQERKEAYITLNTQRKTYNSIFKKIKYFKDGENFIFYGEIEPIKVYGNNYSITFKDRIWIDNKQYPVNMYITDDLIINYRLSRLFRESIHILAKQGSNSKNARCYFVGSYPKVKEIQRKEGKTYIVYEVVISNLDHLVIKFEE